MKNKISFWESLTIFSFNTKKVIQLFIEWNLKLLHFINLTQNSNLLISLSIVFRYFRKIEFLWVIEFSFQTVEYELSLGNNFEVETTISGKIF